MFDPRRVGGILRSLPDFRQLWLADAVSQAGTRVSFLAFPLLAVTALHASAVQTSLIRTAQTAAALLIGLPAGAWCDRMRCRPVLLLADVGRALLLGSVPVAAALGVLGLPQVYAVVFVAGILTVFFDVAHQSYLPRLVGPADLVEANAKLAANQSVAATAGPAVGGLLVQWLTAPIAVAADALSYLASAGSLRGIRDREPVPERRPERRLTAEVREGLGFVLRHPIIRPIALFGATEIVFQSGYLAISVVFLVRSLHLSAGVIGLLSSVSLLGAVLAAACTRRIAAAIGDARCMLLSGVTLTAGALLVPFTTRGPGLLFFVLGNGLSGFSIIVGNIVASSTNQRLCPAALRGRMNASLRFLLFGMAPVGSLLGGVLASAIGLRGALWVVEGGVAAAVAWLVASPLRSMRDLTQDAVSAELPPVS